MELSDIEVMQTPEEWPHRVVLPLKRYSKTPGAFPDSGFITNKTGCRVFLENIFSISLGETPLELVKSKQYDSFEAILADGWMVD